MTELRITRDARGDLRDIRIFSKERFGTATAKAYMAGLQQTFVLLLERPLIGALQDDLASGVRAFAHRSHRIYYRVGANEIGILRVLHHARVDARGGLA